MLETAASKSSFIKITFSSFQLTQPSVNDPRNVEEKMKVYYVNLFLLLFKLKSFN